MSADHAIWAITALAIGGVVLRPWKLPEALWACIGAALLPLLGLLPWSDVGQAIGKGTDVYLFLVGMILTSTSVTIDVVRMKAASSASHSAAAAGNLDSVAD